MRLVDAPLARKITGPDASKKPLSKKAGLLDVAFTISYEQKRELSMAIERMAEQGSEQLASVIDIIRSGMPAIGGDSDEIELDMDVIDQKTLLQLWRFVMRGDPWARDNGTR